LFPSLFLIGDSPDLVGIGHSISVVLCRLVSMTDVCINAGIVLGFLVGFICDELIENVSLKW